MQNDLLHHITMMSDKYRNKLFANAIKSACKPNDCVVEIGTGLGLLSLLIARQINRNVHSIEYNSKTLQYAKAILSNDSVDNIKFYNMSSFDFSERIAPDILCTETFGPVGVEENIVELCFEFKSKYPMIRRLIPETLQVFMVPFYSQMIDIEVGILRHSLSDPFSQFSLDVDFAEIVTDFMSTVLQFKPAISFERFGDTVQIGDFELGRSFTSEMRGVHLFKPDLYNGILFYFESKLTENIKLSTQSGNTKTHWGNNFILKPAGYNTLSYCYDPGVREWQFKWS